MKHKYIECECGTPEHILRFTFNEEDQEVYVEVFLNKYYNIFKRFWYAIKYIFNKRPCNYGYFDCTLLSQKGSVIVEYDPHGNIVYTDELSLSDEYHNSEFNLLKSLFKNGKLLRETNLGKIRKLLNT